MNGAYLYFHPALSGWGLLDETEEGICRIISKILRTKLQRGGCRHPPLFLQGNNLYPLPSSAATVGQVIKRDIPVCKNPFFISLLILLYAFFIRLRCSTQVVPPRAESDTRQSRPSKNHSNVTQKSKHLWRAKSIHSDFATRSKTASQGTKIQSGLRGLPQT